MGGRGKGKGGERGEDVEGPGKWSAPGPVLALGGPALQTPSAFDTIVLVDLDSDNAIKYKMPRHGPHTL